MDRLLWPVSNWLWANILDPLIAGLLQLTPRRIVYLAFFAAFAFAFAYAAAEFAMSADLALLLAGDSALYFEIATFSYVALVRGRMDRAVSPLLQRVRPAALRAGAVVMRTAGRARRRMRLPRLFDTGDSGDVPDGAFALT